MEYLSPYKYAREIEFLSLRMWARVIKKWQNSLVYYFRVYSPPFFTRIDKGVKEKREQKMKVRTMIMIYEGCEMNEKMKLKPKTKQNATKYKVNMTC